MSIPSTWIIDIQSNLILVGTYNSSEELVKGLSENKTHASLHNHYTNIRDCYSGLIKVAKRKLNDNNCLRVKEWTVMLV